MIKIAQPLLALILILSCRQSNQSGFHASSAAYFKNIILEANKKLDSGHVNAAFQYVEAGYASGRYVSEESKMIKYTFYCNYYYNNLYDNEKAMLYADSMLALINYSNDKNFINKYTAVANYSKGDCSFALKKYNEAYQYYYKAKTIAQAKYDVCSLNDYSYRLGMVMYKKEQYVVAARYFKLCLKESSYCEATFASQYRHQELLSNIALCYNNYGKPDSALLYYTAALNYLNKNNTLKKEKKLHQIATAVVYGNMAQIYSKKGNYSKAEDLFNRSIYINQQKGNDNRDAQFAQINLADMYLKSNQLQMVTPMIPALQSSLDTLKNETAALRFANLLWRYFEKKGDKENAFIALQQYLLQKEAMDSNDKIFRETSVLEQTRFVENQYAIEALHKNISAQRTVIFIAIVFALMATAIILLIHSNVQRAKTNITKLTRLNTTVSDQKVQLELALNQLEQQANEKDKILRIVAHDLRTPISGIAGLTDLLLQNKPDEHEQEHILTLITNTCADSLHLIHEILEVAGLSEIQNLQKQPTDINQVLSNTVELLQFKAIEKNQRIILHTAAHLYPIPAHKETIVRLISNIISNAIKFSPSNETIYVSARQNHDGVLISVKDNGIGIPEQLRDNVFNTFTKARRNGTMGEKSFGLGLSICRQIVDAHHGKIWFESEAGLGTTFNIELYDTRFGSMAPATVQTTTIYN